MVSTAFAIFFGYYMATHRKVESAADFLVFTAVVWNLWLSEYQAFKTIPKEMVEVADNYNYSLLERLKVVYIPFSIPRIAANLFPSVSDGFFYITVSEVFSIGITTYETCFQFYSF